MTARCRARMRSSSHSISADTWSTCRRTAGDPLGGVGVAGGQRDQHVVELRQHDPAEGNQPAVEIDQFLVEGCRMPGLSHLPLGFRTALAAASTRG